MNLTATMKFKVMYISSLVRKTVGMLTYRIKMPTTGLAHFIRNLKKQKWEKYNGRALEFCFVFLFVLFLFFFYTKFHVQALKSTLTGTYEIYSLSYRTF